MATERTAVESDKRGYTIAVGGEAMTGEANYFCSVGRHCCRIGIRACHVGDFVGGQFGP